MNPQPDAQLTNRYTQVSIKTADDLRTIAQSLAFPLSSLTLPEIEQAVEIVAKMVPAGNVPGVILNGLARLAERRPPPHAMRRDIQLLFRGVEQVLDKAVYGAFFAGPAAVIWGYQNLLKLAGKSPEDAFPEGTWQFYAEYALREDTARHANETHGFDTLLRRHGIQLSAVDRISAWVMTAIYALHQYPALLENEWRERVYTRLLAAQTASTPYAEKLKDMYRRWEAVRPYARREDAGSDSYPIYRRKQFDQFWQPLIETLPQQMTQQWWQAVQAAERDQLPAYQRQMSILSSLEAGDYAETRTPIHLRDTLIGIVYNGAYSFIPVCKGGTELPNDPAVVRAQVATILSSVGQPAQLTELLRLKRSELSQVLKNFSPDLVSALEIFHRTPILMNANLRDRQLPLAELRQTERGIGSHALTIFDTGETFVFDQSHIYFDGAWGSALAEIMTNEALSWARYFATLPPCTPDLSGIQTLRIVWSPADRTRIEQAARIMPEVGAETSTANVKAILSLRKLFKGRSDLLQLTVNDLLILYRAIHALTYRPSSEVTTWLKRTYSDGAQAQAIRAAASALELRENPAILIPIDASQASPMARVFPVSFEVPLNDLNLLELHQQTLHALAAYEQGSGDRTATYGEFDRLQREYLATLAAFGVVMNRAKEIALSGESASVGTIKLLAHIPKPLQRLLDKIPSHFEVLNDIIKGREVFSNVGAVASSSTLTRFITAKDDNQRKTLAWGVITDANGTMVVTLRDFRPYVAVLMDAGLKQVAELLVRDYVESYAVGLNQYIRELRRITMASRETRLVRRDKQ